jgi:hypothetical protein
MLPLLFMLDKPQPGTALMAQLNKRHYKLLKRWRSERFPLVSIDEINETYSSKSSDHLPIQKREKISPSKSSDEKAPVISFNAF